MIVLLDSAKLFCIYLSMPIYTLHEDRKGGDLFLFTHLTVEVSVFIYLFNAHLSMATGFIRTQVRSCFRL